MKSEEISAIKGKILKDLYRFRNGVIAENLKNNYSHYHHRVYGLLLPQISDLSKSYPVDFSLAKTLWEENESREHRILSIFLMPHNIEKEWVLNMIKGIKTYEEAELLPFKLLKSLPYSEELFREIQESCNVDSDELMQHLYIMFRRNLDAKNNPG